MMEGQRPLEELAARKSQRISDQAPLKLQEAEPLNAPDEPPRKPAVPRESAKISDTTDEELDGNVYINSIAGKVEKPRRKRRFGNASGRPFGWLSNHKWFARSVQFMILANSAQMGAEVVWIGEETDLLFLIFEQFFTAFFFMEMVIRMYCDGKRYFIDKEEKWWNFLDMTVVSVSVVDAWIFRAIGIDGGGMAESLKILRLARLLRVLKLLREYQALMLLIESIVGSLKPMGWLAAMLLILIYAFAIFCVQVIGRSDAYPEGRGPSDNEEYPIGTENITLLFGDLWTAMFALSGLALGHRAKEIMKALWYFQVYVLPPMYAYMMLVMFGVLNAMIGIVCQKTKEACQETERLEELAKQQSQKEVVDELKEIMYKMDVDADGTVSQEELEKAGKDPKFQQMLRKVELPPGFRLVDVHLMLDKDGDGELSEDEFADGMYDLISGNSFQQCCILMRSVAQGKRAMCDFREEVLAEFATLKAGLGLGDACNSGPDLGAGPPQMNKPHVHAHAHAQAQAHSKSPTRSKDIQGHWEPLGNPDIFIEEAMVVGQPIASSEFPPKCASNFMQEPSWEKLADPRHMVSDSQVEKDNPDDDILDNSLSMSKSGSKVVSTRVEYMQMAAAKYGGRGKTGETHRAQRAKALTAASQRRARGAPQPVAHIQTLEATALPPQPPAPVERLVEAADRSEDLRVDDIVEVTDMEDANYIGDTLNRTGTSSRPELTMIKPSDLPPGTVQVGS